MKRDWSIWIFMMVVFCLLTIISTVNVLQQVQIKDLNDQVEILGLEADTFNAYMRDQNSINSKLVEKIVMLEQADEIHHVQ